MPQKAGVLALAGFLAAAGVVAAAAAGQTRGQMTVSAYVMVTTSIAASLLTPGDLQISSGPQIATGLPPTDLPPSPQSAAPAKAGTSAPAFTPFDTNRTICANVALSCSSNAPVRINLDGASESAVSGETCGPALAASRQSFGLCGQASTQSHLVAVTIEY